MRKFLPALIILAVIAASTAFADPHPLAPSKGRWLYFWGTLKLYRRADFDSSYSEVESPEKWLKVSNVVHDKDNNSWYKVKIDGQTGWLPQTGVRIKTGGKSKAAANLYKQYAKKMSKRGERPPHYFYARNLTWDEDIEVCREFFGMDIRGKTVSDVRGKLGTPTYIELPYFLYYELDGYNMTLSITFNSESEDKEGTVKEVYLTRGGAGDEDGND